MNPLRSLPLTFLLLSLCFVADVSHAQDKSDKPMQAGCLLRITSPRSVLPINGDVIERLLWSTPVAGAVIKEVFELTPSLYGDVVSIRFTMLEQYQVQDQIVILGELSVELSPDALQHAEAEQFLAALCRRLHQALKAVGVAEAARWENQLRALEADLDQLKIDAEHITATQRDLFDKAGREDLDRDQILNSIRKYESMREEMRLRLLGMSAKQHAVTEQIAALTQKIEKKIESNEILAGLRRIVELRKNALDRMRKLVETGQAGPEEANRAEEELIRAQADMARVLEQCRETENGSLIAALGKQLIDMSIEIENISAELGAVEERLSTLRERCVVELAARYADEVERPRFMIERRVMDLRQQQHQLKEKLRGMLLPEMQVIGQ